MKLISMMALALVLTHGASGNAEAKEDEMIALTGCVRRFAQGGYFFSDVVTDKGFCVDSVEPVQPTCETSTEVVQR